MVICRVSVTSWLTGAWAVQSTAFILLQGVPSTISLDEVRDAILEVDGVLSVHELHIWQLSESKIVASVHVMASRKHDFMPIASQIRKALHERGIHSSTIQPEYHSPRNSPPEEHLMVRLSPGLFSPTNSRPLSCRHQQSRLV